METVDQLIIQDQKVWNTNVLHVLFDTDTVDNITKIRIPESGIYKLRWTPTKSGIFTVKSAYRVINDAEYSASQLKFPWLTFWKAKLSPKILHFLWKGVHNCLLVNEKLSKHVRDIDEVCPLCKSEYVDHLLINQPVTITVWFALDSNFVTRFVNQIQKELNEWNEHLSKQAAHTTHQTVSRVEVGWTPPRTGFHKINFDAYFLKVNKSMGIGLIMVDDAGVVGGAWSKNGIADDEVQAEALAAYEVIK
ncbi:uncharacterized protein LOC113291310 [Papaver somniferum]|uniref:uncharacterized protein LOC113291310 n=1 Tax=Papaver somniferum TaxID=3469 RepID=UPI000E70536B|nr:uncharacterized protein LOC113291310 [Papaver somniferum]